MTDKIPGLSAGSVSFSGTYDASIASYLITGLSPERDIVIFPKGMRPWHPMLTSRGWLTLGPAQVAADEVTWSGDFELKWPWRHEHVGVRRWLKHLRTRSETHTNPEEGK